MLIEDGVRFPKADLDADTEDTFFARRRKKVPNSANRDHRATNR